MNKYRVVILNESETRVVYRTTVSAFSNMGAKYSAIREYKYLHPNAPTMDELVYRTKAYKQNLGWFQ